MTEIQEMAQAIHEKHKALWPLTWAVADFMAKRLAGDQGYLIVNQLTHELMELNSQQTEPVKPVQTKYPAYTGPGSSEHSCVHCDDQPGGCVFCYKP